MIAKTILYSTAIILMIAFISAEQDVVENCKLVARGTKLPSLISCQTHYICQGYNDPIQKNCTGTTVFSKNAQSCVPETDINCFYGLSNPCLNKHERFAPSDKGCNMWNYCLNGQIAGFGSCPYSQIFYAANESCFYGDCDKNKNSEVFKVGNICEIMPEGVFFGDTKDCTSWYKCNAMTVENGNCLNGLVFDTNTGMCLQNEGNMCQRTSNVVISQASGPPAEPCTNVSQIIGDTNICSTYYTCKVSSDATTYEWVPNSCENGYFDVLTKKCNQTSLARSYPGCDRCQFTNGNIYWANDVDRSCSKYLICNQGKKVGVTQGSCGEEHYYNQDSQYCIKGNESLSQYKMYNGACQDYSCNDARICTLADEGDGEASENGVNEGSPSGNGSSENGGPGEETTE